VVEASEAEVIWGLLDESRGLEFRCLTSTPVPAVMLAEIDIRRFGTGLTTYVNGPAAISSKLMSMLAELDSMKSMLLLKLPDKLLVLGSPWESDMSSPWAALGQIDRAQELFESSIDKFESPVFSGQSA
jgi:hypothetical protein